MITSDTVFRDVTSTGLLALQSQARLVTAFRLKETLFISGAAREGLKAADATWDEAPAAGRPAMTRRPPVAFLRSMDSPIPLKSDAGCPALTILESSAGCPAMTVLKSAAGRPALTILESAAGRPALTLLGVGEAPAADRSAPKHADPTLVGALVVTAGAVATSGASSFTDP
jgi:hypothetical protein